MKKLILAITLVAVAGLYHQASAQTQSAENKNIPATYLKFGLTHWQGDTYGFVYNLNGLNVEIESYFSSNHLLLSGWSMGYRKDGLQMVETGQMLNFRVFRNFGLKWLEVKTGGGADWGSPSLMFDKTKFDQPTKTAINYTHVYPVRNSNIPFIGTPTDGILYPFLDLTVAKRMGPFIVEAGSRANIIRFGKDNYRITNDSMELDDHKQRKIIQTAFINFGLKLF